MVLGLVYSAGKIYHRYLVVKKDSMASTVSTFPFNVEIKPSANNWEDKTAISKI